MSDTPPPILRVFCVDDNELVGEALRRRIEQVPDIEWLGLARNGAEVIDRVREIAPHIVLMDIDMPGVDTFGLVQRITTEMPEVRIIMFSGHVELDYIDRALDAGAWGYLSKNDDVGRLLEGIRQVSRGEIALSRDVEEVQRSALNMAARRAQDEGPRGP
jgi:DNA-binding NarL/FixJ family response regulator